jgi:hypothetical protein
MFTFWNYYVLKLLRLETITFSDATLSDINVVLSYVLSQYHLRATIISSTYLLVSVNVILSISLEINVNLPEDQQSEVSRPFGSRPPQ